MCLNRVDSGQEEKMIDKDKLIEILANSVYLGIKALPDSESYGKKDGISWVWEECTDEEQEEVKKVRVQLNEALEIYEAFKMGGK